jgi:toxin CptA
MPITIRIAPSRLAGVSQGLLALAVVGVLSHYGPVWLALLGILWLGLLAWHLGCRGVRGELRLVAEEGGGGRWCWRPAREPAWQDVELRCRYLGPWLIALQLAGRTLWLWPDSADRESLRQLRRWLVQRR